MSFRIFASNKPNTVHYVTAVTNNRVKIFKEDKFCQILAEVIDEIRVLHPFKLIGYVFMPDHFHTLINPLKPEIETIIRKIKGKCARRILDTLIKMNRTITLRRLENTKPGRRHSLWRRKTSDIDVVTSKFVRQKLQYIHMNPVRAGLCETPGEWKWSSYLALHPAYEGKVPLRVDLIHHWTSDEIEAGRPLD